MVEAHLAPRLDALGRDEDEPVGRAVGRRPVLHRRVRPPGVVGEGGGRERHAPARDGVLARGVEYRDNPPEDDFMADVLSLLAEGTTSLRMDTAAPAKGE